MSVEISQQLETAVKGIEAVQGRITEMKSKLDVIDKDVIDKAARDATDALAAAQEIRQKANAVDAMQKRMEDLEAEFARNSGAQKSADPKASHHFARYLRKGDAMPEDVVRAQIDAFLAKNTYGADETKIAMQQKDLLAGSGPDGGYLVTADRSSRMITRIFETSPVRLVADVQTTTSDVFEMVLDDQEADCGWVGEITSRADTNTPGVGLTQIPVHELYAQPKVTQKLIDDVGFDIEGWLVRRVAEKIGRTENTAFVVGDGSAKPRGFLAYPAWASAGVYERKAVEQITSSTSGDFTADDVIALHNALLEDYQGNATFGMQRATFTKVMQLKATNGEYLLNPRILMEGGEKILLGSNVIFMSDMPTVAANALAMVVADFSRFYTIVDRFDVRVLRDPYTSKPYVKFYTTKRTGGAVMDYAAGKIMKIKA